MKTIICPVMFLLLVSTACSRPVKRDASAQRIFPVTITGDGFILLNVRVSNAVDARFILDTGAGIEIVSDGLLRRVASTPGGRFVGIRYTGQPVNVDLCRIGSLSIGAYRQENPVVAPLALLDSLKVDGILSLKFFEHHPFTLDLKDSVLIFETPASLSRRMREDGSHILDVDDIRGKSIDCFCKVRVADSLELECIIDTGSFSSYLDACYAGLIGIDTTSSAVQRRTRKGTFGAMETEYTAQLPSIAIWDYPSTAQKNFRVIFQSHLIYDGLIGMDYWLGRIVTFDIADRRFSVRPGIGTLRQVIGGR